MSFNSDNYAEIKRKIRELKRLEIKIRFGGAALNGKNPALVWNDFFASKKIEELALMGKEEYRQLVDEFFINVYFLHYRENGYISASMFDPELLARLGLPFDSDSGDIKKRFRELAKKYHPDAGGDSEKFIELLDTYKKITGGE